MPYRLLEGPGVMIEHHGERLRLAPGAAVAMPVRFDDAVAPEPDELPRAA